MKSSILVAFGLCLTGNLASADDLYNRAEQLQKNGEENIYIASQIPAAMKCATILKGLTDKQARIQAYKDEPCQGPGWGTPDAEEVLASAIDRKLLPEQEDLNAMTEAKIVVGNVRWESLIGVSK